MSEEMEGGKRIVGEVGGFFIYTININPLSRGIGMSTSAFPFLFWT
jgi:hypothetical protein